MRASFFGVLLVVGLSWASDAAAQGGDGSLRGVVRDTQGGALPGVTVTATSPAMLVPRTDVSDAEGNYRLINLPPGTYTMTAELTGFSTFRREGILVRAGANFQVDVALSVGTLEESITVTGDSPMLEVSRPSNVLNIDAVFQKTVPLVEGKYWSDFLMMTPGVMSRPHNDGSGRQNYFGNAVDHRDAVAADGRALWRQLQRLEYQPHRPQHGSHPGHGDQDRRRRCGLADGLRARHQHDQQERRQPVPRFGRGPYQPLAWNENNVGTGTPATRQVYQYRRRPPAARCGAIGSGSSAPCGSPTTRAAPAAIRPRSPPSKRSSRMARSATTASRGSSRG